MEPVSDSVTNNSFFSDQWVAFYSAHEKDLSNSSPSTFVLLPSQLYTLLLSIRFCYYFIEVNFAKNVSLLACILFLSSYTNYFSNLNTNIGLSTIRVRCS